MKVPSPGESITEVEIASWLVEDGDYVEKDQAIAEVDSDGDALEDDEDAPYLLSLEYQYKLNDNIQITPGGYVLFNPDGNSDNDNIYVGTIRTIFSF